MVRQGWMTDEVIQKARELGDIGRYELARATGLSEWKARMLLEFVHSTGGAGDGSISREADRCAERIMPMLSEPASVDSISDSLLIHPTIVRESINRIREMGYPVDEVTKDVFVINRLPAKSETETPLPRPSGKHGDEIRIGIVADTHLGSKSQQITHLWNAYREFADMGISTVYHAGDVFAGVGVYRGQHNDLFLHSYAEQVEYAEQYYPMIDGITTYAIAGNHDVRSLANGGSDPVVELSKRRPDIVSLGITSAWAKSSGGQVSVYLLHPSGASGFSPEYKLRRLIAHLISRGMSPTIAVCGHWHQACRTRKHGIIGYMPGCFESITDYETRKMLQPQLGALAITIRIDDSGKARRVTEDWIENLSPVERDYQ